MKKTGTPQRKAIVSIPGKGVEAMASALFFLIAWLWAAWWMGDVFRMAREYSFFAADETLMHGLWQQPFGTLWITGRALLTLYRWPWGGGLVVALLLTASVWLTDYCLRLRPGSWWRGLGYLPATAWMTWVAWKGLNLYFQGEPGSTLGVLLLGVLVLAIDAFIIWTFKRRGSHPRPSSAAAPLSPGRSARRLRAGLPALLPALLPASFLLFPFLTTHLRHPYLRPVTRMEVQLLHEDWQGMMATAHDHAELSYRPLAAYYAIALVHTGHLTDQLLDIRLDYDSLRVASWGGHPDLGTNYYLADCNYHAGLFRAAAHNAMEGLTMNGPSLKNLKHLARLALLDHDWALARKYLHILSRHPFEGEFVRRYTAMLDNPEAVEADPLFAQLRRTEPVHDSFESFYQQPTFLGYAAVLTEGRSQEALMQSLMANLYSKRMPDFLMRCEPLMGTTPPRTIAEGLVTQAPKNPAILQAFPQLQMNVQVYQGFLRTAQPYMKDRARGGLELFNQYRGYYPYYYFFGNLKATRKRDDKEHTSSNAGVN
ncbi:MAG: hypothetical protein IJ767_03555 [Bacteroidaceae bacterium]|nr:hypothetical protein [Bacteroidaceae bacterium]MBR1800554.1 hypothetical protein [Bacteroidaceae bacterium]